MKNARPAKVYFLPSSREQLFDVGTFRQRPSVKEEFFFRSSTFLKELWLRLREGYFTERPDLDGYSVVWSNRNQTRTLACCNVMKKRVTVASVLQSPEYGTVLEPLLYHEMCHAVLGIPKVVGRRRVIHGRDFRTIERLHPAMKLLDEFISSGGWSRAVRAWRRRMVLR